VQVIRHHRKSQNINPEDTGEKLQTIPNPFTAMLVSLSRQFIDAAETTSSNTAIHPMNQLNLTVREDFSPIDSCHE